MMLSFFTLVICLALVHGEPIRKGHMHNVDMNINPVVYGTVLSIETGTSNCSHTIYPKCYTPRITVKIPDFNGEIVRFRRGCGNDVACAIDFLSIQNPVTLQYYNSSNSFIILFPSERHEYEVSNDTIYFIIAVMACMVLCVSCRQAKPVETRTASPGDVPPMYTPQGSTNNPPVHELPTYASHEARGAANEEPLTAEAGIEMENIPDIGGNGPDNDVILVEDDNNSQDGDMQSVDSMSMLLPSENN